jgi:hypothetical protein
MPALPQLLLELNSLKQNQNPLIKNNPPIKKLAPLHHALFEKFRSIKVSKKRVEAEDIKNNQLKK